MTYPFVRIPVADNRSTSINTQKIVNLYALCYSCCT